MKHLDLSTLPVAVLVILGILAVAELALDVVALVSLARRPRSAVALGNKWVWVAIILLLNLVGAILYLVIGRKPLPPVSDPAPANGVASTSVADSLYGERHDRDAP